MKFNPYVSLLIILLLSANDAFYAQKITSFTPTSGPVGTLITVTGTGFGATPAANTVFVGGVRATVTSASATQLQFRVPAGTTLDPISVTAGGVTGYSARSFVTTFSCGDVFSPATLGNTVNFDAGYFTSPISIAIADLNGDGKPDIISTDQDGNSITVFENTSSHSAIDAGSFATGFQIQTGLGPAAIALADFNNDGKMDIAVVNNLSSTVSIIQNNSSGGTMSSLTFGGKVDFPTSTSSTDSAGSANIAVGDLDGDGKTDFAVSNTNKNTISVFHNIATTGSISTSSFDPRFDLAGGTVPLAVVIADIDGDAKPDIAFNNSQGLNLSVYRNNYSSGALSSASFVARVNYVTDFGTSNMVAADLTDDGKPELILANLFSNSISIFRNTATSGVINAASFAARVDFATSTNPVNIAVSDFTGDGKPDLAVSCWDINAPNSLSNPINFYRNTVFGSTINTSSFANAVTYITGGSSGRIGIADLDADGKPDIVVPNYTSDLISVLKNNSSSFTGIAGATVNASTSVCNDGIWKNIYDPINPSRIIAAVKDNGLALGALSADVYVDASPGAYRGNRYLPRHFVIRPGTQPTGDIQLRLYFTDAEFAALQAVDNSVTTVSNLSITKYQGPTEDGQFNPSDATSIAVIPATSVYYGNGAGARYAEFTASSLSEFWLHSNAIALPVDLLVFEAKPDHNSVLLSWKAANEVNLEKYVLERSSDGLSYASIGSVQASGTTAAVNAYEFSDGNPLNGQNFYRLRQQDKDGKFKYSDVRLVSFGATVANQVIIAPHPVIDRAVISLSLQKGLSTFTIYDIRGTKMRTYSYSTPGKQTIKINFEKKELPSGAYLYKLSNPNQADSHGKLLIR